MGNIVISQKSSSSDKTIIYEKSTPTKTCRFTGKFDDNYNIVECDTTIEDMMGNVIKRPCNEKEIKEIQKMNQNVNLMLGSVVKMLSGIGGMISAIGKIITGSF